MTCENAKLIRVWLVCLALVSTPVFSIGTPDAFGEEATLYRLTKHKREKAGITAWFHREHQPRGDRKTHYKLKIPLKFKKEQAVIDGVLLNTTALVATLQGEKALVYEIQFSQKLNKVRSVEERTPTAEDSQLFAKLLEESVVRVGGGEANGTTYTSAVRSTSPSQPEYKATIYTADNCPPCQRLKQQIESDPNKYGCNDITWVSCGADFRNPSFECRRLGITSFPTTIGRICNDCDRNTLTVHSPAS